MNASDFLKSRHCKYIANKGWFLGDNEWYIGKDKYEAVAMLNRFVEFCSDGRIKNKSVLEAIKEFKQVIAGGMTNGT